ncbi:unnamed protein product [Gongylonema pulchrum]|uniref:Reverse transcriptase domain-containing protein n=1 Tax=Gongylonema pulchrum TaxID=637853 RepID=A0A183DC90_9BILA|nr:unnamed protein product [Gongylonema pulchrum]
MWKVSGQDNLLEQGCDIKTQQMLRVTAQGPMTPIILLAYLIEVEVRPNAARTYVQSPKPYGVSRSKMPPESVTQSISGTYGRTPGATRYVPITEAVSIKC